MLKKLLACALAVALIVGAPMSMAAAPRRPELANADLKARVIVQLEKDPVLVYETQLKGKGTYSVQGIDIYNNALKRNLTDVLSKAKSRGVKLETAAEFTQTFYGFSASVPFSQIAELEKVPGVKKVFPDMPIYAPDIEYTVPQTGAPTLWEMPGEYTGEGTIVAIVDTGIDYGHPYLYDSDGEGGYVGRVIGGWNFTEDREPDDPMDGHGHGTHVAGIVAANGTDWGDPGFKGMAPAAQLYAIKVLADDGRGYSSWVISGMEWAVNPGDGLPRADVINMSLGASGVTDPNYPTCLAADAAAEAGVIVAASSGNDGHDIPTASAPSLGPNVISVASYGTIEQAYIDVAGEQIWEVIPAGDAPDPDGNSYGIVYAGLGYPEDFDDIDVTGKIALIQRGAIAFSDKADNAAAAGAIATIIFNNATGTISMAGTFPIPAFSTTLAVGEYILELLDDDPEILVSMNLLAPRDLISPTSSGGPANNYALKPDITAPGYLVESLYPCDFGYFAAMGGTSMACPHVSGAAALLKQKYGDLLSVEEYKALLMNTAALLYDKDDVKYPVTTIGAGVLDLSATAYARGLALPASFSLRLDGPENTVSVRNISEEEITYDITFVSSTLEAAHQDQITVAAGATAQFDVLFDMIGLDDGAHEGYLILTPTTEAVPGLVDRLQIPVYHYVGEQETFYLNDFEIPNVIRLGSTFDISFRLNQDVEYMELDIEDLEGYFYGGWDLGEDFEAGLYSFENFDPEGLLPGEYVFELYAEIDGGNHFNLKSQVVNVMTGFYRLAGRSRYATAVEVSKAGWNTADTVILARGDDFADSLAGVGLSKKLDAPILLTRTAALSEDVVKEIERLGATDIIILGGEGAVSAAIEAQLKADYEVERIAGKNRYETAARIGDRVIAPDCKEVIVVYGRNYPDALAAAPLAFGAPILMTNTDVVPQATLDFLVAHGIEDVFVVGGSGVISDAVVAELEASRFSGKNRYETAALLAEQSAELIDPSYVFIASGENFADALCLSALAAKKGGCLLLVRQGVLPDPTANYLAKDTDLTCVVIAAGGEGVIGPNVWQQIEYIFYPTE